MIRSAVGHALMALATVVVAVVAMQALLELAPGDAIDLLPNSDAVRDVLSEQWSLNKSLPARVVDTLTGRWGSSLSLRPGLPVSELIAGPLWRSLSWWLTSGLLLVTLATVSAVRRDRLSAVVRAALGAASLVPLFLLAHLVVGGVDETILSLSNAGWMSRPAWFPLPLEPSGVRFVVAVGVLTVGSASFIDASSGLSQRVRQLRNTPFALAAKSRGEPESTYLYRHLGVAIIELVASRAPMLLGGLVILEKVLLLNGAGSVMWNAAVARDYPVALALTVAFAAWVAVVRACCDTAHDALTRRQVAM